MIALITNAVAYLLSDKMALRAMHAVPVAPAQTPIATVKKPPRSGMVAATTKSDRLGEVAPVEPDEQNPRTGS